MLLYLTGSKSFNIRVRNTAKALGYRLTNRELLKTTPRETRRVSVSTEEQVLAILGMEYVPPRFRVL